MARKKEPTVVEHDGRRRPRSTEAWERRLTGLAFELVEQRLMDGTATSQETVHFLKLATEQYKLENKKLEKDITLSEAKREALEAAKHAEEKYSEAIAAVKTYISPVTFSGDYNNHG